MNELPDSITNPPARHGWRRALGGAAILMVVAIAGALPIFWGERAKESAVGEKRESGEVASQRQLTSFVLTNTSGGVVTRADLQGKWVVANFVFSACSISCMEVNYRMREIQQLVADREDVVLISFTIDPVADTPPVLAKFAAQLQADTNQWTFLTGSKKELNTLLEQSFLGPRDPKLAGIVPGGWPHIDQIAVVNPEGRLVKVLNGMKKDVARVAAEILGPTRRKG